MSGYIPPVVVSVLGDDRDFVSTIAKDKALLLDFAKQTTQAHLGLDEAQFRAGLLDAKGELLGLTGRDYTATLDLNTRPFLAELAKAKAEAAALSSDFAHFSAINAALAGWGRGGGGGGGSGGFLAGMFAGKGGGNGGGLASLLGFGASAGLFGMAGMGSIASFAGLGAEHLLMTGVGLAGSAAGGLLGGSLLGLGSLGVTGVGMGTDMAGMGQAANDAKQYSAALNNLNQAIAVYGPKSQQAADATKQLQYTLSQMPTAAQGAIVSLVNTKNQFRALFDQLTGPAEKVGAQILQQAMQVGEKFLPTIGKFAAQNMGIIQSSLQPLFGWLQGPGLAVFTQLEQKFQQDLPTAMHAFDQGLELLVRTLGYLAPQTGGLIHTIDRLVTKFNGAGWTQWEVGIQKLIGDFRQWEGLVKILVADIYQLFHHDAGTASGIVQSLTQMLTKLHAYETSAQGGAAIHNLFETHKREVLELLNLLPSLISTFGRIEMTVAPQMTSLVADVLRLVNWLLRIPDVGRLLAWGAAIAVVASKMKLLSVVRGVTGTMGTLYRYLGLVGTAMRSMLAGGGVVESLKALVAGLRGVGAASGEAAAGEDAAAASTGILDAALGLLTGVGVVALAVGIYELYTHFGLLKTAMIVGAAAVAGLTIAMWALDAVPIVALIVGIGLAVAGLIAGIVELATHWSTVWNGVKQVASAVWGFLKSGWGRLLALFMPPIGPLVALAAHWSTVWNGIKAVAETVWHALDSVWHSVETGVTTAWNAIVSFISGVPRRILAALAALGGALLGLAMSAWNDFKSGATTTVGALIGYVETIPHLVIGAFGDFNNLLFDVGKAIIEGLIHGIESMAGAVRHAVGGIVGAIKHIPVIGGLIGSPSPYFIEVGQAIGQGLTIGVNQSAPAAMSAVLAMAHSVQAAGARVQFAGSYGIGAGVSPAGGAAVGAGAVTYSPTNHITINPPSGNSTEIAKAVARELDAREKGNIRTLRAGVTW